MVIIIINLDKDRFDLYNDYNNTSLNERKNNEINRIIRSRNTYHEIIDYLDQVYDRKYTRSTVKTYITKLKKKRFVDTQVKGNYSYITAKITEEMYREEQMELMKDFWHDGSMKELVQTLTHTISKEEKEEFKDLINDFDD